jgi:hypothetical protein|tara:strand:+ start:1476 stop:1838 length:363 start_codon:yes stop_codon:yes gene_type:complete
MELAIFITSLAVVLFLAGLALERQVKYRRTLERLVQAEIDRVTTAKYLLEAHQELENYRLGDTEEFVKFLSTSREWAFDFIDEFQVSVQDLFAIVDNPEHEVSEAVVKFKELKKFLPKEM